jgi:uncharacterized ubiquitin-like protein YukD
MKDIRFINETEFEITPQVLYDTAFMSLPEFWNYYSIFLRIPLTNEVKDIIESIWEDLKIQVINHGVDRSLRPSDKNKLIAYRKITQPQPKIKRGRGRPKG